METTDDWHWQTKDNKIIHIRDMDDQHLENCIRIIKNNNYGYTEYYGDENFCDSNYYCLRNKYENMINELRLRKLEKELNNIKDL